jgi:hypothetical protein
MSGMANEMQRRMEADGGAGLTDEVPGNEGGSQPPGTPPAAGPSTTDTGVAGGPPDTIPYARFKEVNDRLNEARTELSGYETLRGYGYDPDSLGRLAAFETQYLQDPNGTWKMMADNLDLPQEVKDAITQYMGESTPDQPAAEETPAQPQTRAELSPEDRARLEYVDRMQQREAEAETARQLDGVLAAWDQLDTQDSFEVRDEDRPAYERMRLMAISATAGSGTVFPTVEALAQAARSGVMDYRSAVLGGAVQRTGRVESPPALPGSPPVGSGPVHFDSMRQASKAALAAIERGELPPLGTEA